MRKFLIFFIVLVLSGCLLNFMPQVYATELFSDGFESGNFNAWTGTTGSPSIVEDPVHHGSYAAYVNNSGTHFCYKTFTATPSCNLRAYYKFTGTYSDWVLHQTFALKDAADSKTFVRLVLVHTTGNDCYWHLFYLNGANELLSVDSDHFTLNNSKWYCLEVSVSVGNGNGFCKLYVDGVNILNTPTNLDNDNYGNVTRACVGQYWVDAAVPIYWDCVVVADAYIGPEEEGEEYSFDLTETLSASASLETQKNLYREAAQSSTIEESSISRKQLYRATSGSTSVTTIIETQKDINVHMIVEIASEVLASAILETTKHMAATLIELLGTALISSTLQAILPIIPLTAEEAATIGILFAVVVLVVCVALIYRRKKSGTS